MKASLPVRGQDDHGSGHYGASRGDHKHRGIDYSCYPGTAIYPYFPGKVTKLGYPYADKLEFRYVQVTDIAGYDHRYFYIEPSVRLGDEVTENTVIGYSQELPYEGITQHVHYEVKVDGINIDPATV